MNSILEILVGGAAGLLVLLVILSTYQAGFRKGAESEQNRKRRITDGFFFN